MPAAKKKSIRPQNVIRVRGARQNNLKGIDIDLPLNQLTVITGPSGSGKSSLAFDTIYAEGQRRYVETFSPYTRQFFERMDKPQVDSIEGIPPAIAIEQVNHVRSTRSTVGTITELNDYLKMLFPRVAAAHCPQCKAQVKPDSADSILRQMLAERQGETLMVCFPLSLPEKTDTADLAQFLQAQGFLRLWLYGKVVRVDDAEEFGTRKLPAQVHVIQDRITVSQANASRLSEALESALRFGKGKLTLVPTDTENGKRKTENFSTSWSCATCNIEIPEPTPGLFSFNNPIGACASCRGFGKTLGLDMHKAIPDESLSINEGLVRAFSGSTYTESLTDLKKAAKRQGISLTKPLSAYTKEERKWLIEGENPDPEEAYMNGQWYGVRGFFKWLESRAYKMHVRIFLARFRAYTECEACGGGRLKPDAYNYRINDKTIADLWKLPVDQLLQEVATWSLPAGDRAANLLRTEITSRLSYLDRAGLAYLNLDRQTRTLSGGELQRVNLTTCLGASLVSTLFVLDEPSIGLHPRDIGRLIGVMEGLRDKGNTLLVVEHEESVMRAADHLIDIGPGRGAAGGELIFAGNMAELAKHKTSLTGDYLFGRKSIPLPERRRAVKLLDNPIFPSDYTTHATPASAYEAILRQTHTPLRDGPSEAARSAQECAQELTRGATSQSFGWARRSKRERLLDEQLAVLNRFSTDAALPTFHIGGGGEHEVYAGKSVGYVVKVTNKDQFGYVVDQDSDNEANKLLIRPALPSEYLMRQGTQNLVFGDEIRLAGIQKAPVPRIVVYQEEIDLGRPTQDEINDVMLQLGFVLLPEEMLVGRFGDKRFWYRPEDSLVTADANMENFSRANDGQIVAIDVIVHPYPRELIESTARQNGVDLIKITTEQRRLTAEALERTAYAETKSEIRNQKSEIPLTLHNARANNLKSVTVDIPLQRFVCITGVSGSGKSTLVHEVLYRNMQRIRGEVCEEEPGRVDRITGHEALGSVVMVDQSPMARTPRSTPAVFVGAFDTIRALFSETPEARMREITPGFFSFNSGDGRCQRCMGNGFEKIEMQFLSDLFVTCPECEGKRYQAHALQFQLAGKNMDQVLNLTIEEAIPFFRQIQEAGAKKAKNILEPFQLITEAGLGYLKLGQPLNTLSGGEAQRLKLIGHLLEPQSQGKGSLLLLDEPTTGLHFDDIVLLIRLLQRLTDEGHSLVVIEHNLEVIKCADWCIDLGPEGGEAGGQLVLAGTPEDLVLCEQSHTGRYLAEVIPGLRQANELREVGKRSKPHQAENGKRKTENDNSISIRGAREHNLKNIDVDIPRDEFVVVTGLSGSGKSSLAFDLIFAEGQRRFLDSMSVYARTFVEQMEKPEVDLITGVPPTVAIEQRISRGGGKSTVATVTEVYHFLRLLFAKLGTQYCPTCQVPVKKQSVQALLALVQEQAKTGALHVLAPLIKARKGFHTDVAEHAAKQGIETLLVDGELKGSMNFKPLARFKEHSIDAVIARIDKAMPADTLRQHIERAVKMGKGTLKLLLKDKSTLVLSTEMSCPQCSTSFEELDPRLFSFNSPHGWCRECRGFGVVMRGNPVEDAALRGNDVSALELEMQEERRFRSSGQDEDEDGEPLVRTPCKACGGSRIHPVGRAVQLQGQRIEDFSQLAAKDATGLMDKLKFTGNEAVIARDIVTEIKQRLHFMQEVGLGYLQLNRSADTLSGGEAQRIRLSAQLGSNLRGVLYVLDEPTIGLHPRDNERLLDTLMALRDKGNSLLVVEHDDETMKRADTILDLGPGAGRFGGQVIARGDLAAIMKDKASVTGHSLRHPMQHPVRGSYRPVEEGVVKPKKTSKKKPQVAAAGQPDLSDLKWLTLTGASANNLKGIDVQFPLARLSILTGVSGSGKSSLLHGSLLPAVRAAFEKTGKRNRSEAEVDSRRLPEGGAKRIKTENGKRTWKTLTGMEHLSTVHEVDQSPIGKTSRSCPATYVGIWDDIRKLFAQVPLARTRGYGPGRFSYNTEGGRCPTCEGNGAIKVEMNFLPTTSVPCESCKGSRFNSATLEVLYDGKNIGDVMRMSIDEAAEFFAPVQKIARPLKLMADTGLGYLQLGQPSPTLSGGEAQRIKLVTELRGGDAKTATEKLRGLKNTKKNLYLIEEPTIGLHMQDVARLIDVLHRLVDEGHTVIVIEHHPDVFKEADWLVDIGPEAGEAGGKVVAMGTVAQVAKVKESRTARFLV